MDHRRSPLFKILVILSEFPTNSPAAKTPGLGDGHSQSSARLGMLVYSWGNNRHRTNQPTEQTSQPTKTMVGSFRSDFPFWKMLLGNPGEGRQAN